MKPSFLVSALLASSAWAHSSVILKARLKCGLSSLTYEKFPGFKLLSLFESRLPSPPKLKVKEGIVSLGDGDDTEHFGVMGPYLAFGKHVQPLTLKLDKDFRVTSINPFVCKGLEGREHRGYFSIQDDSSESLNCCPIHIYLVEEKEEEEEELRYKEWYKRDQCV